MSEHTPGPWSWECIQTNLPWAGRHLGIYDAEGWIIAELATENVDGCPEANADIIAAAPELLEACELALVSDDRAVKDVLRAAIAKAKGDKP